MTQRTHPLAHPHDPYCITRSGWLRATVLGANDGIVSAEPLIVGVANASPAPRADMPDERRAARRARPEIWLSHV